LLPKGFDELLVGAGGRLLVGHHIEQQADRTHVQRDEDEAPFHHPRFGIVAELVYGNIPGGEEGDGEPDVDHDVERL